MRLSASLCNVRLSAQLRFGLGMLRTHFDLKVHLERLASFQLRALAGAWVTATQDGEFGQAPDATPMGRLDETIVGTITTSDERIGAIFLYDVVVSDGPLRLHKS